MNSVNPNNTSFMHDLWYFEFSIAFKPTYLNMNIDFYSINLVDLIIDIHWNLHELQCIFGETSNF